MTRIGELINELKKQIESNSDPAEMLRIIHALQSELDQLNLTNPKVLGTSKVAVILPKMMNTPLPNIEKNIPRAADKPAVLETKETLLVQDDSVSIVQKNGQLDMVFDPMLEIPTLSHHLREKEINELGTPKETTLNDRLKQGKAELMEILKETPVKDLRKAIGINDRFHFVHELFRGDESMYERSIKTINSFNIYAEAEYWINRELKVKLAWDDKKETVIEFYQLVKRRFS